MRCSDAARNKRILPGSIGCQPKSRSTKSGRIWECDDQDDFLGYIRTIEFWCIAAWILLKAYQQFQDSGYLEVLTPRHTVPRGRGGKMSSIWSFIQELSFPRRVAIVALCAVGFGASLTTYVIFMPGHPYLMQVVASCIKVPALLFICPLLALYPTLLLSKLFDSRMEMRVLLKASFSCIVATAIVLALCAPFIAILNSFGNYTLVIFASYGAFAVAGLTGCVAFYWKLVGGGAPGFSPKFSQPKSALRISGVWLVLFGLVGAEVGWSIRPFVGWTGQPFEWLRPDHTQIWDQLNAETDNLRVGGLSFPQELEKRFFK
jgi:hypothetical protein